MARVTVEDCLDKVNDRFELVAVAAQRAKSVAAGEQLTIERKGEKNTVLALREIAAATVPVDSLREGLVRSFQREREYEEIFGNSPISAERAKQEAEEIMKLESEAEEMAEEQAELKSFDIDEEGEDEEDSENLPDDKGDYKFEDEDNVED